MRVFDGPRRLHRPQIPAFDVIVVGGGDGGRVVMRIPFARRQFRAWIQMMTFAVFISSPDFLLEVLYIRVIPTSHHEKSI